MEEKERNEIAYKLLKYFIAARKIQLDSLRRDIGNVFKSADVFPMSTVVEFNENIGKAKEFTKTILSEIIDEQCDPARIV